LEQLGKVRPIGDLSPSQINSTMTCYEQATFDGPDVIGAFCIFSRALPCGAWPGY
jgi:hypothetical protein